MVSRSRGPLTAYRITISQYAVFDGAGTFLFGGRWTSPGRRVIYAAEHFGGAMLESLAHFNIKRIPRISRSIRILIPAELEIEEITASDVPGWDAEDQIASRAYGDAWHEGGRTGRRPAVLIVPSKVVRVERNVLIDQDHPDFGHVIAEAPEPVTWDPRVISKD
ncbi:MAG: RES family NAD+ phosphorylase [Pseudomonadota bacterium]